MSNSSGQDRLARTLREALEIGIRFKASESVYQERASAPRIRDRIVKSMPKNGRTVDRLLKDFSADVLPFCKNEASPRFLGFGDTGDDAAALAGEILAILLQQNLINQSFDAPSATFVEITVLRWLRELTGYPVGAISEISSVWDAGGIVTHGGTASNAAAMMLAREHRRPGTMTMGVQDPSQFWVIVPRGIGHYSVRSALSWIGVGAQVIEADCVNFRYDLQSLRSKLEQSRGRIMAVVAYAGDSRMQSIEHLRAVHNIVRSDHPDIWLHVDACWGFLCTFSESLRGRVDGIELYDSITIDAHKILDVPYSLSALLVRDFRKLRAIASFSDLIMQEDFAFGQATPFVGTRGWLSLKLWMMMQAHGRDGLAQLAERRVARARRFAAGVDANPRLLRVNDPDLLAVAFLYVPESVAFEPGEATVAQVEHINAVNLKIHSRMMDEGVWHLHQFSVPDNRGTLRRDKIIHPLRLMTNNDKAKESHLAEIASYIERLGKDQEVVLDG